MITNNKIAELTIAVQDVVEQLNLYPTIHSVPFSLEEAFAEMEMNGLFYITFLNKIILINSQEQSDLFQETYSEVAEYVLLARKFLATPLPDEVNDLNTPNSIIQKKLTDNVSIVSTNT